MRNYMKTLLSAGFLLCAGIGYSQQTEPTPVEQGATPIRAEYKGATHTEAKQSKAITISKKAGEPQRVHDVAYYNEEIAKVDAHITAIDAKIGHVNADILSGLPADDAPRDGEARVREGTAGMLVCGACGSSPSRW